MKIGLKVPNSGPFAEPHYLREFALEAERLGFDCLWVHDHIHRSVADAQHHFAIGSLEAFKPPVLPNHYESMVTLSYLAGCTSQIGLGTSVIVLPTRNPTVLAKEAACLDQLSGGRLLFGVGVGGNVYAERELGAVGALQLMGHRGKVVDEWIEIIRHVWTDPVADYVGEFGSVKGAEVYPKPLQKPHPPILIGGFGEKAFVRCGLRGDGLLAIYYLPDEIRHARERIREVRSQAGRPPDDFLLGNEHWLSIDTDRAQALERPRATMESLGGYLGRKPESGKVDPGEAERHLFGDPAEITEKLLRYREAGVDQVILRPLAHDFAGVIKALRLFRERVMDHVREPSSTARV